MIKALGTFLITTFVIAAAVMGFELFRFSFQGFKSSGTGAVLVEIERGTKPVDLSAQLERQGIVSSKTKFLWAGKVFRKWGKIKAGEYEVSPRMTPMQIFNVFVSGISAARVVTLPEGDNLYQVAQTLERKELGSAKEYVALMKDPQFMRELGFQDPLPPNLEGYLFPETYHFGRKQKPREIVAQMVRKALAVYDTLPKERLYELGFSRHQVFTLASMIEKETGAPFERAKISGVFHNRLKKRMRLQSDPTTIYGIWERYKGNISRKDLLTKTPYNTYMIPALPIGPIANPGKEALQAALFPETSDALFFVSRNDGTHVFTSNFKDHNQAVTDFQLNAKAREGKSWRDLKKRLATPTPSAK